MAGKKGEVAEVKKLLATVKTGADDKRKRDVVKKVIAYMTLGIDVSSLMGDMVVIASTRDIVVKKMVYLFLTSYAQQYPDLTMLTINTLQKDCADDDPTVRGLALRALSSLRVESVVEYLLPPLNAGLRDDSGYVRKTAALGIAKMFRLNPRQVTESDMVDTLYGLLRDSDPQVVTNAIAALNEVLADEGGIAINQLIVHHLLSKIREFSEWGQCQVLELVAKYTPADEKELFGMMNLLDVCLKVSNTGVVLAVGRCFIAFTRDMPAMQTRVFERLRGPLLTLMSKPSHEVAHTVLCHIRLIIGKGQRCFERDFKQFFCRYDDPPHIKHIKLDILPRLACPENAGMIATELTEYVSGVNAEVAKHAIRAIALIAIRLPESADGVIDALASLVELGAEWITSETVVAMRTLLRKFPQKAEDVMPTLHGSLQRVEDPAGRAAVIWMLGEYGHLIDDAPYTLEPIIDAFGPDMAVQVQLSLLTATMKLFFKRPPEVQAMLTRLFKTCLDGDPEVTVDVDVHDRALLYYRLLRQDPQVAQTVLRGSRQAVDEFLDDMSDETRTKLFEQFNTLSVLYEKPEEEFIDDSLLAVKLEQQAAEAGAPAGGDEDDGLLGGEPATPTGAAAGGGGAAMAGGDADLLGGDLLGGDGDLLGGGGSPPAPAVTLDPSATLAPPVFKSKWGACQNVQTGQVRLSAMPSRESLQGPLQARGWRALAFGDAPQALRAFFYGVEAGGQAAHLVQLMVNKSTNVAAFTLKSENEAASGAVRAMLEDALGGL